MNCRPGKFLKTCRITADTFACQSFSSYLESRLLTYLLPTEPFDRPLRLAVLISGGGTTLDNFQSRIDAGELPAEVAVVIASRADCRGVEKAKNYGFPTVVLPRRDFSSTEEFSENVFAACREAQADLVTLAGFLSLISIPEDFLGRVMNIHPSLIPSFCGPGFYGSHVHKAVHKRGVRTTGCTVHFADNEYDHGPIIVQKTVPVFGRDTPDDIAARVFEQECVAYPEAIALYQQGKLQIREGRVWIDGE